MNSYTLYSAIEQHFRGNTALSDVKLFEGLVVEQSNFPHVRYYEQNQSAVTGFFGHGSSDETNFVFDVFDTDAENCGELADEIAVLFNGATLELDLSNTAGFIRIFSRGPRNTQEKNSRDDYVFHAQVIFRCFTST